MLTLSNAVKVLAITVVCGLYFYGLASMGLVTPDEPRYADIGRAMAQTGDWITPRLFGSPWYEKPALLYWMAATGYRAGLGPEWAPRLPVALLSVGFIWFFWWRVKAEWGRDVAGFSAAILATSAGWLAFSHVCVTDIPVSVFSSAALLLALPWFERGDRGWLPLSAACLGLAVLAKGLVPFVFFAPVVFLRWRRFTDWLRPAPIAAFSLVALPWYGLCSIRSNGEFLRVFFLEHHLGRFGTAALQHVQPWWFYLPVLLLLLFPWSPLIALIRPTTSKSKLMLGVTVFGIAVFSVAVNKLPGYVLPLLPPLAILFGEGLVQASSRWKAPLALTAGLVGLLPFAGKILPVALAQGLRAASFPWAWCAVAVAGLFAGAAVVRLSRMVAFTSIAVGCGIGFFLLEVVVFPSLDSVSARPLYLRNHPTCTGKLSRTLVYGLEYYAGRALPECAVLDQRNPRVVR